MYNKLIIYYFTGTGNALAAAKWMEETAQKRQVATEILQITPSLQIHTEDIPTNSLIGFCYPTHGFNAPPIVVDFCLRFPKVRRNFFILNTRAGMKLYRLFTPGMTGLAQLFPALILRLKGMKLVGLQPMDLPSNWISIHPGLRQKVVTSIFDRCKRKTKLFAERTLSGVKTWKGLLSLPIDLLVSPISILYFFFGRFFLAKSFVADYNCNSCGLCVKQCPVKAIVWKENRPFWTRKCESCMHCMNLCPKRAIQTPHAFVVLIWWLVLSLIPVTLVHIFSTPGDFISEHFSLFVWIFILLTAFPIVVFSYRILHFLMRYSFINRLVSFTSLTKFRFWRRYNASK